MKSSTKIKKGMTDFMNKRIITAIVAALSLISSSTASVLADKKFAFQDISDPKYSWAVGYIEDMTEKGFIKGYEDGTYKPDKSVTRLEVLSLFARAIVFPALIAAIVG